MAGLPFNMKDTHHHCAKCPGDAHGGIPLSLQECKCNPGHEKFFTLAEFKMKYLPEECRLLQVLYMIRKVVDRTVKILLSHTSSHRPDFYPDTDKPYPFHDCKGSNDMRYLTGYVEKRRPANEYSYQVCRCFLCKSKKSVGKVKCYFFLVGTATHGIFDDEEAEEATFELFYNSDDRQGVEFLYGVRVVEDLARRLDTDITHVICVTHDSKLAKALESICGSNYMDDVPLRSSFGFMVSHPHGASKRISIGKVKKHFLIPMQKSSTPLILLKGSCGSFQETTDFENVIEQAGVHSIFEKVSSGPKNFKLRCDVTVTFPMKDSIFKVIYNNNDCIVLPTGTQLMTNDGKRFCIAYTVEIDYEYYQTDVGFAEYDIACCPGSSGACVIRLEYLPGADTHMNHHGKKKEGEYISGLTKRWGDDFFP